MVFAALAQPFIPETSAKVTQAFAGHERPLTWPAVVRDTLEPGSNIRVPDVLFAKIEETQVTEWTERFGGADT
jgi:methionyl-tRNA synthetase